jgi:hypothetical protein
MKSVWILGCLLLTAIVGHAATSEGSVVVTVQPPTITRRTFDPKNPPAEMPKLKPPEVGTCVYSFRCTADMEVKGPVGKPARLTAIEVKTYLTITLWTPQLGPNKILEHEEGHRAICEVYYGQAEAIARRFAEQEMARTFRASASDKAGIDAELKDVQDNLLAGYLGETARRCDFAQARYDEITQHSISPILESTAINQALREEKESYEKYGPIATPRRAAGSTESVKSPPTRPAR